MMSSNYKYSNVDVIIKGINVTFNILTVTLHVHMSNLYTRKSLKLREMSNYNGSKVKLKDEYKYDRKNSTSMRVLNMSLKGHPRQCPRYHRCQRLGRCRVQILQFVSRFDFPCASLLPSSCTFLCPHGQQRLLR